MHCSMAELATRATGGLATSATPHPHAPAFPAHVRRRECSAPSAGLQEPDPAPGVGDPLGGFVDKPSTSTPGHQDGPCMEEHLDSVLRRVHRVWRRRQEARGRFGVGEGPHAYTGSRPQKWGKHAP